MSNLEISQLQAARQAQRLTLIVFLVLLCTIAWATFATLDEVIVGEGNVVPAQTVQTVENLDGGIDRKSTRLNSSHPSRSRMPSSA